MLLLSAVIPAAILWICFRINRWLCFAVCCIMSWQIFAAKCLKQEAQKVQRCLDAGDLPAARRQVSMLVGRDTEQLTETQVAKAAIETVAENTSDGVIAPLFYMMLGGPVLGFVYKAINTMDSMLGYKNEKYIHFGRCAARTDDVANYIPARLSALGMIAAAPLTGFDGKNAARIWRRDRRKHASPNSAQTESVCAGALHIQLAGNAYYFGKLYEKPFIGDPDRAVEPADISRTCRLMYGTSILLLAVFEAVGFLILYLL
jgi:adenosylcobinamide-phosphate synthase